MTAAQNDRLADMKAAVRKSKKDAESAHGDADDVLCGVLIDLSKDKASHSKKDLIEIVKQYGKVKKYYA